MSTRSARAAAVAAVGAIIAGALPTGAAFAASTTTVTTGPGSVVAGATTPTVFDLKLNGLKDQKVKLDFVLDATSGGANQNLTPADVKLELLDPATNVWKSAEPFGATGAVTVAFNDVITPATAADTVKARLAIVDKYVDGTIDLITRVADGGNVPTITEQNDTDVVEVAGVSEAKATIAADAVAKPNGAAFNVASSVANTGSGLNYNVAARLTLRFPTAPSVAPVVKLNTVPATVVGSGTVYTVTVPGQTLPNDGNLALKWNVQVDDPKVAGKLGLDLAVIDQDISNAPVIATASGERTLQAVGYNAAVTAGDFDKATAKTDDPTIVGDDSVKTKSAFTIKDTGSPALPTTALVRYEFEAAGLKPGDITITAPDAATGAPAAVALNAAAPGKLVGYGPILAAPAGGNIAAGDVTVTVAETEAEGTVAFKASVVDSTKRIAYATSAAKSFKIESVSKEAAPVGVTVVRGTADGTAILSWGGRSDTTYAVEILGADGTTGSTDVYVENRSASSKVLYDLAPGESIVAEVRAVSRTNADGTTTNFTDGKWGRASYTAPAAADLAKPSDAKIVLDPDTLRPTLTWSGTANRYKVVVTDLTAKTRQINDWISGKQEDLVGYGLVKGHEYSMSVMSFNGSAASPAAVVSVTPKAPVAPSPVVSLSGGKQVVTWTPTDLSSTTVTVNGARVATSGNSVVVDNLQAGANTVAVTVENVYGVQTGSVTIDNGVKVSFTGTPSSIVAGDKVTFTGAVDSVKKAEREVQLQTASDSGWKNVGSVVKTNAAGEFTLTATPASTTGFRVEVLTTAGATGAISSEKVVSVTPKPATAPKTIKATASASTTKPRAGQVVTLLNKAPGAPGNTQVTLQKLVGKSWKKVLVSKTTAAGNTAFRVKAVKGIQNYRIVVSGSKTTKMAISNTVKLTVR